MYAGVTHVFSCLTIIERHRSIRWWFDCVPDLYCFRSAIHRRTRINEVYELIVR